MATRGKLPSSSHSITRGGTPQPFGSYALSQGWIVYLSIYPWLKHEIFTVTLMSSSIWRIGPFRVSTQQCARHSKNHKSRTPEQTYSQLDVQHPVFCSFLQQLHDDHRFSHEPFCALAEFKVLPDKAKKRTSRGLSRKTLDCFGAKFSIASTALRTNRNRHLGTLMRCCEAWKPVED